MASILEKFEGGLDRLLSVKLPEGARLGGPVVYRSDRGDGTTPGAAVARPQINKEALADANTTIPNAGSEMWALSREIANRDK